MDLQEDVIFMKYKAPVVIVKYCDYWPFHLQIVTLRTERENWLKNLYITIKGTKFTGDTYTRYIYIFTQQDYGVFHLLPLLSLEIIIYFWKTTTFVEEIVFHWEVITVIFYDESIEERRERDVKVKTVY